MQQSEAFHQQLRAHYAAIVAETFARARHCMRLARTAQQTGNCAEVRKWVQTVRMLRFAAAEWRSRAQRITPVLFCLLWCLGCAKAPETTREFSAAFDVAPTKDGQRVAWSLHFSLQQYHRFLDSAREGAERADVRELIVAGLRMHHLVGCDPHEQTVTKLDNGDIAFIGECPVEAHAVPAGGI